MFEIETSRAERLIYVRMIGGFTLDEARECAAAKEAAVQELGPPFDAHSSLVDVRDLRIQTRDVFAIFTNFVAMTKHKSRKVAIVGGEGTARMQFRRVAEREPLRDNMRFFTAVDDARSWLEERTGQA
ncbi:MAG TPA: STAS/SEC14 domain-containing protein [Allosphingosinicella sp.]|nr:STAS/SEC14 domain-containing protein [Allosphingosinicella sp.]